MVDDPRLQRPHPDLLASHRRCPMCPPGRDVHPLDASHFYERTDRYPWQASRFSKHCKAHDNERRRSSYSSNAQAQNRKTSQRRRVARENMKTAAILYAPEQIALHNQREQERKARKERIARWKRVNLRTNGPRDGIKALIRSRQTMYAGRRRALASVSRDTTPRGMVRPQDEHVAPGVRQSPQDAYEALRHLRARHEKEQEPERQDTRQSKRTCEKGEESDYEHHARAGNRN